MGFTYCVVLDASHLNFSRAIPDVAHEVRLDTFDAFVHARKIRDLIKTPLIATFRTRQHLGFGKKETRDGPGWQWRMACLQAGFEFIDLEMDEPDVSEKMRLVQDRGKKVVLSHHQSKGQLDVAGLLSQSQTWKKANIVKIIGNGRGIEDFRAQREAYRAWNVRANHNPNTPRLVHFYMGAGFESTRILSLFYGAPFTFVTWPEIDPIAAGQMTMDETCFLCGELGGKLEDYDLFGVAGWPIAHSLSPKIHLPGLREKKRQALFLRFPGTCESDLRVLGQTFPELKGLAVTKPLKEVAAELVEDRKPDIGAINTLLFGKIPKGRNTDYDAMRRLIEPVGKDAKARILGYGGLGKAALRACLDLGIKTQVTNRTEKRMTCLPEGAESLAWERRHEEGPSLFIQATSVGMTPDAQACPIDFLPNSVAWVLESVYEPPKTQFLTLAERKGVAVVDGLTLFELQAKIQHEHFLKMMNPPEKPKKTA